MASITHIQNGEKLTVGQQAALTLRLSAPAMMAQLSTILMQYVDASMVGRLGADQSASVGLMNSSLWLFWGVCSMVTMGFSVQVAHQLGAKRPDQARDVLRQGIVTMTLFGLFMGLLGIAIAPFLPVWLGGAPQICHNSSLYFGIFVGALPVLTLSYLAGGMLRCAGNMKIPSLFNVGMCLLDVVFNWFLIFPSTTLTLGEWSVYIPRADLGVTGAALGTVGAECICAGAMLWYLWYRQADLRLSGEHGSYRLRRDILRKALNIAFPMAGQQAVFCGAQIMVTVIVAPLGVVAIAANAFAITAESLCYMPGFGIADAATTLCGQAYGAGRMALVRSLGWITTGLGIVVMTVMGAAMYICAPWMMELMSPVPEIIAEGTKVLRIEAFAEPMYAASIVAYGAFVGAGDTLIPAVMNFGSIWLVRITLAALLAPLFGLAGVWIAMAIELTFRGIIFLCRMKWGNWLKAHRTPGAGVPDEQA